MTTSIAEIRGMNQEEMQARIKERVLERIKSPIEWPSQNHGADRAALLQVAFDQGWYMEVLQ